MPPRLSSTQQATLFRSAGLGNLANEKKPATSGSFSSLTASPAGTGRGSDKVEISKLARQANAAALQQNAPTANSQTTTATSTATNQNSAPVAEPELTREQTTAIGDKIAGMVQSGASQAEIDQAVQEQTATFKQENAAAALQQNAPTANSQNTPTAPANNQAVPASGANSQNLSALGLQNQIADLIVTQSRGSILDFFA